MRILKILQRGFILSLILCGSVYAKYSAKEILIIGWGNAESQLPVENRQNPDNISYEEGDAKPLRNYPDQFFVDKKGIIYFGNHRLNYIKGFSPTGIELYSISASDSRSGGVAKAESNKQQPKIGEHYNLKNYSVFCIDTLSRMYIQPLSPRGECSFRGNVFIVDSTGIITEIIQPQNHDLNTELGEMKMNSMDVLTFGNLNSQSIMMYKNGKLSTGGYPGWLGPDDYYYTARIDKIGDNKEKTIVEFTVIGDSTNPKIADDVKQTIRLLKEPASQGELIGIADDGRMFLKLYKSSDIAIQVYDKQYTLLDEVQVPYLKSEKRFDHYRNLLLAANGDIYEFHNLADGLHIIKWTNR
jgi:hypothetical protein